MDAAIDDVAILMVGLTGDAVATDVEAVSSSLWLRSIGGLAMTRDSAQEACFRFHGPDGMSATGPSGGTFEAGQHALADRTMVI
jgi:hypothetical protein